MRVKIRHMKIGGIPFQFISPIVPKVDSTRQILEFSPASRYKNKKNLPLHKYGSGPFCRFKIDPDVDGLGVYCIADGNNKRSTLGNALGPLEVIPKSLKRV